MKKFLRGQKGFTLIELVVVMAILGILAAIIVPTVSGVLGSSATKAATAETAEIQSAMDIAMADMNLLTVTLVPSAVPGVRDFSSAGTAITTLTPAGSATWTNAGAIYLAEANVYDPDGVGPLPGITYGPYLRKATTGATHPSYGYWWTASGTVDNNGEPWSK